MPVRYVASHPHVMDSHDRVSVFRGPLLYCAEGQDHDGDVRDLIVPAQPTFNVHQTPELGGALTLSGQGKVRLHSAWEGNLYQNLEDISETNAPAPVTLVPYFSWANRLPGRMQVWFSHPAKS